MNKFKILLIVVLFVSSAFSLNVLDSENGILKVNIWGQSSAYYKDYDGAYNKGFDLGRYRMRTALNNEKFSYSLVLGYEDELIELVELSVKYKINDFVSFSAGKPKAPFGRINATHDSELLMYNRNPLENSFSPINGAGILSELALNDSTIIMGLSVFNRITAPGFRFDKHLNYSGAIHIMPFGKMDLSETAKKKYDKFKMDIVPGFYYDAIFKEPSRDTYVELGETPMITGGIHTALRYSYLVFDAMAYYTTTAFDDSLTYNLEGYSAQLGYLIMGNIEPSVRYSYIKHPFYQELENDSYDEIDVTSSNIELGTKYYFDNKLTSIGVYYYFTKTKFNFVDDLEPMEYNNSGVRVFLSLDI